MKKKTVKEIKMHKLLVCACKSQDFAQSQKKFVRSHDRETVTFRNFGRTTQKKYIAKKANSVSLEFLFLSS